MPKEMIYLKSDGDEDFDDTDTDEDSDSDEDTDDEEDGFDGDQNLVLVVYCFTRSILENCPGRAYHLDSGCQRLSPLPYSKNRKVYKGQAIGKLHDFRGIFK